MKFTREQVVYILAFFARNGIVFINIEDVGKINLEECRTDEGFIIDSLIGDNPDAVYP